MRLLDCLPSPYNTTVDTLKARSNVATLKALRILQNKEEDLKIESGMIAYSNNQHLSKYKRKQQRSRSRSRSRSKTTSRQHQQRKDSPSSERKSKERKPGQKCFLCGEDDHILKDYNLRTLLATFVKKLRQRKKKGRAYDAESESEEDNKTLQEEDEDNENNKIAVLI